MEQPEKTELSNPTQESAENQLTAEDKIKLEYTRLTLNNDEKREYSYPDKFFPVA